MPTTSGAEVRGLGKGAIRIVASGVFRGSTDRNWPDALGSNANDNVKAGPFLAGSEDYAVPFLRIPQM